MHIKKYTLKNQQGMTLEALNYGGIITSLKVPDRQGRLDEVVLGFDHPEDYLGEHPYFGCIVGRFANRIAKGKISIEGEEYQLSINNGPNSLHGGLSGFDKHFWETTQESSSRLTFFRLSPDGEEGYPGNLSVKVSYELTSQNELFITYQAQTDRSTYVNLTNHSYFNLGTKHDSILDHELMLMADRYTVVDEELIPTGELRAVQDTPMDYRTLSKVRGGFDHNFVLTTQTQGLKHAATLIERKAGRAMDVFTTEPGIQFYSGNFLDGSLQGRKGQFYQKHAGLCLETQHFPDSPHWPQFPSTCLRPQETFESTTVYKFYTV